MISINFKDVKCECGGHATLAERCKYQERYKLYCSDCGKFIKFASTEQKIILRARAAYIEEHKRNGFLFD